MFFRGRSAAEHSGEFQNPLFLRKFPDGGHRRTFCHIFFDSKMTVGTRSHLREMGNTEQLFFPSQLLKFSRHNRGDFASDIGVNFIEHEAISHQSRSDRSSVTRRLTIEHKPITHRTRDWGAFRLPLREPFSRQ